MFNIICATKIDCPETADVVVGGYLYARYVPSRLPLLSFFFFLAVSYDCNSYST